jgi:hypothetical protein
METNDRQGKPFASMAEKRRYDAQMKEKEVVQPTLIYAYTRKQAIEDGVLADVSTPAKEAGFKVPVAITSAVYEELCVGEGSKPVTYRARLWDVLALLSFKCRTAKGDTVHYEVKVGRKVLKLWSKMGPGDDAEPVITIMMENED